MRRSIAIAAALAALGLAGCGDDESATTTPAKGPKAQEKTNTTSTAAATTSTTATTTPTAPASAGDSGGSAPDSGISTRPGGPSGGY